MFSYKPQITTQSSQEGSSERSRSQRGFEVGAAQSIANPVTPSQSMTTSSSTSQSTPEPRGSRDHRIAIPENWIAVQAVGEARGTLDIQGDPHKSPETLSQFLGSPQSSPLIAPNMNAVQLEAQGHVHSNPFHGQYATRLGQQGAASSQGQSQGPTFVKNELNVSMDPFVVAQAAQAVEEARSNFKSQAIQAVEESKRIFQVQATQMVEDIQTSTRTEAMQYLERFQSQAQRAISESQAQSIQLQKGLEDSRAGTTQIVQDASKEIEDVKSQTRAEIQRVKVEAQSMVSGLEGRISELIRINGELSTKSGEQIKLINALTQRVDEQQSLLSPVQNPQVQPFDTPSQHGESPKDAQLKGLVAEVKMLASVVHSFASNQRGGRKSKGNGSNKGSPNASKEYDIATPPKSPPGSSSSSSSSKGSGGGGSGPPTPPRGSNASRASSSSDQSRVVDPYKHEKKIMRVKQYDHLKIPNLPKSASDARAFRNSVFNLVCKPAKGDEEPVSKWIENCVEPKAFESLSDSLPFPLLDRVLGSKLLEHGKNTRFAMHFQTMQESYQRRHKQPKGRQLLWITFDKYKMERDRGVALTQSHLLNLKMQGSDMKALEDFRNKFDFIWQALEVSDRPSDSSLRSLLFEQLKSHSKLQLAIDRCRNSSGTSSKRSYLWLYDKLVKPLKSTSSKRTQLALRSPWQISQHPTRMQMQPLRSRSKRSRRVIKTKTNKRTQKTLSLINLTKTKGSPRTSWTSSQRLHNLQMFKLPLPKAKVQVRVVKRMTRVQRVKR